MTDKFLYEVDGRVATITFNRPERRNGLNAEVLAELESLVARVRDDEAVRALILTGTGNSFCAGAEPVAVAAGKIGPRSGGAGPGRAGPRVIGRVFDALASLEVMTVGAINGFAIGGGWSLALALDYCISVPGAEFWVPEVDLGAPFRGLPAFAMTARMGPWLAKEAAILCRHFSAEELLALGVINRIVPAEELAAAAKEVAEAFAAKPARAAAVTKRDINSLAFGPRHY